MSLPRLAAAGGAGWPRSFAGRALLGLVLVEHRLGRGLALGAELVTVVAAPLEGGFARCIGPAEMRDHVAGIKLVGALRRLPIGPIVGLLQEHAEGALLLLQPLDQGDRVVGGAANAVAVLD